MHNATPFPHLNGHFSIVSLFSGNVRHTHASRMPCTANTHSCCSDSGIVPRTVFCVSYTSSPGRSVMGEYILTEVKTVKSRTLKKRSIVMETHKLYISNKIKTKTNCLKCMYFLFSLRCLKHSSGGKPKAVSMERLWVSCTNYNLSHFLSLVHVVTL